MAVGVVGSGIQVLGIVRGRDMGIVVGLRPVNGGGPLLYGTRAFPNALVGRQSPQGRQRQAGRLGCTMFVMAGYHM